MEIQDKVAIVTGAGNGIGRATAIALARAGARGVVIADLRAADAQETAREVEKQGSEPRLVEVDVGQSDGLRRLINDTNEHFGSLHILHNNAGMGEGSETWPDVDEERVANVVDVNLRAVILGTRLAIPLIQKSGGGAIVNTASGAAFTPLPPQAVYAATKAGIVHFTRSCEAVAASHDVRVSCVCPGLVETGMLLESGAGKPAAWLEPVIQGVQLLSPEDIAAEVLALIRDPESAGKVVSVSNEPRKA